MFFFKVSPYKSQIRRKLEGAFCIGGTLGISTNLNVDEQMPEVDDPKVQIPRLELEIEVADVNF